MFEKIEKTDPEYAQIVREFALRDVPEVAEAAGLDARGRAISLLATLMGCQGIDAFREALPQALEALTPAEAREVVYQGTAYLGIGRALPFVEALSAELASRGEALPLPAAGTVERTAEARRAAGEQKQVDIFGEGMRGFAESGNPEYPQVNRWLSENCFGDWYTREGLSDADRELATFCYLAAQGGVEPQLTAHARGNLAVGNTKATLLAAVSANLPWIGYPRSLNAISCIEAACKQG